MVDQILDEDDLNKDGYIDYPEFIASQQREETESEQFIKPKKQILFFVSYSQRNSRRDQREKKAQKKLQFLNIFKFSLKGAFSKAAKVTNVSSLFIFYMTYEE